MTLSVPRSLACSRAKRESRCTNLNNWQKTLTDPAWHHPTPHLINLDTDPKEREPMDYPYIHTWVGEHVARILGDYQASLEREPLIPPNAPLSYVPKAKTAAKERDLAA